MEDISKIGRKGQGRVSDIGGGVNTSLSVDGSFSYTVQPDVMVALYVTFTAEANVRYELADKIVRDPVTADDTFLTFLPDLQSAPAILLRWTKPDENELLQQQLEAVFIRLFTVVQGQRKLTKSPIQSFECNFQGLADNAYIAAVSTQYGAQGEELTVRSIDMSLLAAFSEPLPSLDESGGGGAAVAAVPPVKSKGAFEIFHDSESDSDMSLVSLTMNELSRTLAELTASSSSEMDLDMTLEREMAALTKARNKLAEVMKTRKARLEQHSGDRPHGDSTDLRPNARSWKFRY